MSEVAAPAEKPADKRKALGRGLDSLLPAGPRMVAGGSAVVAPVSGNNALAEDHSAVIPEIQAVAARAKDAVIEIPIDKIDSNPYQTRIRFAQESLIELAESIKATGVVQPIIVRPGEKGRYILVIGERRCRASKGVGITSIPAIVRDVSEQQAAEMTVVENLQRQDLNCLEQATAFSQLSKQFQMTQSQIGDRVGLSRESVANYMRLLRLPQTVMEFLAEGRLGFSEARELLKLEDPKTIEKVAVHAVENQLSALGVELLVEKMRFSSDLPLPQNPPKTHGARWVDPNVRAAQMELQRTLGLRVKIRDRHGKGKIVIEYSSVDDYERVVAMLRG